jgi:hypothetical protein
MGLGLLHILSGRAALCARRGGVRGRCEPSGVRFVLQRRRRCAGLRFARLVSPGGTQQRVAQAVSGWDTGRGLAAPDPAQSVRHRTGEGHPYLPDRAPQPHQSKRRRMKKRLSPCGPICRAHARLALQSAPQLPPAAARAAALPAPPAPPHQQERRHVERDPQPLRALPQPHAQQRSHGQSQHPVRLQGTRPCAQRRLRAAPKLLKPEGPQAQEHSPTALRPARGAARTSRLALNVSSWRPLPDRMPLLGAGTGRRRVAGAWPCGHTTAQ